MIHYSVFPNPLHFVHMRLRLFNVKYSIVFICVLYDSECMTLELKAKAPQLSTTEQSADSTTAAPGPSSNDSG